MSSSLEQALALILAAHPAQTISVAMHDPESGQRIELHARERMHAASTMKLAVLLAAFRLHAPLEKPVRVENRFPSLAGGEYAVDPGDDDDPWPYTQLGKEVPLGVLIEHMIARSSNLATNLVMRTLRAPEVERVCRELGARDIRILRGVEDLEAHEKGLDNLATAHDLALLLEAAPPEAVAVLEKQELDGGIRGGVPSGTRVAQKTGDITRHHHDAALVFPKGRRPYVLVVMTRGFETGGEAFAVVREISRTVYRRLTE
ncbi:MAG TPA: serine hydrolase [Myxococcales bacterium]|nr:serine hydrolase [Myxococcales bacterium]